ncbi:MAG: hypothetical protein U1E81_13320 [Xanthobacteraceae bacterium]
MHDRKTVEVVETACDECIRVLVDRGRRRDDNAPSDQVDRQVLPGPDATALSVVTEPRMELDASINLAFSGAFLIQL